MNGQDFVPDTSNQEQSDAQALSSAVPVRPLLGAMPARLRRSVYS